MRLRKKPRSLSFVILIISSALITVANAGTSPAPEVSSSGLASMVGRNVTFRVYGTNGAVLIAKIHADVVFTEFERRGFFRIGVLPVMVAEGVRVQIESAEYLTNALSALCFWNQDSTALHRTELRKLEIAMAGESAPRISADRARLGPDGLLELSNASFLDAENRSVSISHATLQVSGASAGCLRWKANGTLQQLLLLNPKPVTTP